MCVLMTSVLGIQSFPANNERCLMIEILVGVPRADAVLEIFKERNLVKSQYDKAQHPFAKTVIFSGH